MRQTAAGWPAAELLEQPCGLAEQQRAPTALRVLRLASLWYLSSLVEPARVDGWNCILHKFSMRKWSARVYRTQTEHRSTSKCWWSFQAVAELN